MTLGCGGGGGGQRWSAVQGWVGVVVAPEAPPVAGLADLHRDPADPFFAASAGARNATLVTADEKLLAWNSALLRLDARR